MFVNKKVSIQENGDLDNFEHQFEIQVVGPIKYKDLFVLLSYEL